MLAHAPHCGQNEEVSGGMRRVDLNADVGESTGAVRHGDDEGVMPFITSANIACGFHAGDPGAMRATVALARAHGVSVGAHPGFHDLAGFGRRELAVSPQETEDLVAYQVGALAGIAAAQGVRLTHVKPHGALYNMAARDRALADAVVRGVRAVDTGLRPRHSPTGVIWPAALWRHATWLVPWCRIRMWSRGARLRWCSISRSSR
jgi:lactam utilization protein B